MGKLSTYKIVITGYVVNIIDDMAGEALDDPTQTECTWAAKIRNAEHTEKLVTGRTLPSKTVELTIEEMRQLGRLIKDHELYDQKRVTYQSPRHEQNAWICLHRLRARLREGVRILETGVV